MFSIRKSEDLPTVMELHAATFPSDEFFNHTKNYYWIAYEGRKPVGFAMATDFGKGILFLSRAGVLPKYRGNGLHRRLIHVREKFAKRNNSFNSIITYTTISNYQSFSHLIKLNYEIYKPEYSYAGKDVFYFRKIIK